MSNKFVQLFNRRTRGRVLSLAEYLDSHGVTEEEIKMARAVVDHRDAYLAILGAVNSVASDVVDEWLTKRRG